MSFVSIDPASGERIAVYDAMSEAALRDAIAASHKAFLRWREVPMKERAACLRRAAESLRADAPAHAKLMAREMGKPLKDGVAEVIKCAGAFDYYAEHGAQYLARERVMTEARASWIDYEPLGLVLAVMPWNFPFWQVVRFAAPALMAGNGALLKHAANVPGCAIAIERVFSGAGFPNDLFRNLLIDHEAASAVIADPRVKAVTLTGSDAAGRAVAARAGGLLKKTVLELGGSDPYLVLADADLEVAATVCTRARLVNNGQSCIAGKRFIVVPEVRAEFEKRFVEKMKAARSGNPLDEKTEIGPMARVDLRDALHVQVTGSVAKGAKLLLGGTVPSGAGAYYPATVLTDVARGMPAFDEEVFGPVAAIVPVANEDAAVAAANDSSFGLGAAVITRDANRAERIAARLESGMVFVNDNVRSDARLPFGGVKASGYGRELGVVGIKEFVNVKSVYVA
jgi:succinate-semialdehyde dehydrogenase/glutarate-semialdehyde dehydrogenase